MALTEIEMVEGLEAELGPLPDLAQGNVVLLRLAVRRSRIRKVRKRDEDFLPPRFELVELRLEPLELRLQPARPLPQLRELGLVDLSGLRRLFDLRRELVLVRPDRVGPRIQLAATPVDLEELIEPLCRPAPRQR